MADETISAFGVVLKFILSSKSNRKHGRLHCKVFPGANDPGAAHIPPYFWMAGAVGMLEAAIDSSLTLRAEVKPCLEKLEGLVRQHEDEDECLETQRRAG